MTEDPRPVGDSLVRLQERLHSIAARSTGVEPGPERPDPREEAWRRNVPARFVDARAGQLVAEASEALDRWLAPGKLGNLVITGPPSTGKTHMAVAALRVAWDRGRRALYANIGDLLSEMRPGGDPDAYRRAATIDVLLLDDLGTLRDTDWTDETLYRLIDARWRAVLPIIATTNLPLASLRLTVGDRVYERLCLSGAVLFGLTGPNWRRAES